MYLMMLMASMIIVLTECKSTGQPRRHLLQSGWSVFVSSKRLVAGDAFIFLRSVAVSLLTSITILNPVLNVFCSMQRREW